MALGYCLEQDLEDERNTGLAQTRALSEPLIFLME